MSLDIKICGLKTPEALVRRTFRRGEPCRLHLLPESPRNIEPDAAGRLRETIRGAAKAVAVTVDADDPLLDRIVSAMKPDMLQLHGKETPERVAAVKARHGLPVMKALSVSEAADLDKIAPYLGIADRFLFDAKPPQGSELPGGNGVSFDWRLLRRVDPQLDYLLSGGLNARNIGEALRLADPPGIDISSGVESAPGVKDSGLIGEFFRAVRAAQAVRAA